jgi:predicted DNA-binding transcriptional regulator YafY
MNDAVASPTVKELGALANEAAAAAASNSPRAVHLLSLSRRLRASLKWELKRKMGSDLDLIDQVQRTRVGPGPRGTADPVVYDVISLAILQGRCVDFSYRREGRSEVKQVRVVPFGVVHSTVSYLVAQPTKEGAAEPRYYRFDRILMPAISDELGTAPKGFGLDEWLAQSFNIWREPPHDVRIRILASGVARALDWQFHPRQRLTNEGDTLLIEFTCGGLREIAEHLFGWAGQVEIIGPPQLIECMREQLALAATCIPDAKA